MKKKYYAILDSTYSDYFKDLASIAKKKYGYECIRVSYSVADNIYLSRIQNCRARRSLPAAILSEVLSQNNFLQSDRYSSQRSFYRRVIRYLERVYAMLSDYNPKFTIIYNDRRWNHYYTKRLLDLLNYKYFIIERGIFRNQTSTCDPAGLASDSMFYREPLKLNLDEVAIINKEERRINANIYKFGAHFCLRLFESLVFRKPVWHNSKSLFGYLKKFVKRRALYTVVPKPGYTLIPLQLNEDSQVQFYSKYNTSDEFLDECIGLLPVTERIVLAHHPEAQDVQVEKEFNHCLQVVGCTDALIKNAKQVMTINSNVGLRALELGIPVYYFGASVGSKHPAAREYLGGKLLQEARESVDDNIFWSNLLQRYQLPGDIQSYSKLDLEQAFASLLLNCDLSDAEGVQGTCLHNGRVV